jgi:hypothetical protein
LCVQATAFEEQLPPQLLVALLPDLPAGVKVYSPAQLLEFLKEIISTAIYRSLVIFFLFFAMGMLVGITIEERHTTGILSVSKHLRRWEIDWEPGTKSYCDFSNKPVN